MIYLLLVTLLTVAAVYDLIYAKIPNELILAGLMLSLLSRLCISGVGGIGTYFTGLCLSLLTGIVVYAFGVLGAGDIKLICIIGAFLGVRGVLSSIWYAFLFGIIEGGIKIIVTETRRRYPKNRLQIRFALPILLGTLCKIIEVSQSTN